MSYILHKIIVHFIQQIEYKPGPLKAGEDEDYLRALKQEMRGRMKDLPFNIKPHSGKRGQWSLFNFSNL